MNRLICTCLWLLACGMLSCAVFINDDDGQRRKSEQTADTVTIIMTQNPVSVAQ
jgi:hypothetical protein